MEFLGIVFNNSIFEKLLPHEALVAGSHTSGCQMRFVKIVIPAIFSTVTNPGCVVIRKGI